MRKLILFASVSGMLSAGCVARPAVIPDPSIPHQVAEEARIKVWCGTPDRKLEKCEVRLVDGWWVASPQVVE
jgi:hypothetical protein